MRGGYEQPGRIEKITLDLPQDVRIEDAPEGATISGLLADGAIDAVIGPRAPSCFGRHPQVGWLFPDPTASAAEWFRKTGIFPIMHTLGIRRALAERHPWLPAPLMKAFEKSKSHAVARLGDLAALRVTLPFLDDHLLRTKQLLGDDFWSYGLEPTDTCWRYSCAAITPTACRRAR